jgi:NADPH-dependent 2,4-dienoyl-CoA reductase/sulfur reductase-like enzyme
MRIGHFLSLCDSTGMIQHAVHSVPDRSHGCCELRQDEAHRFCRSGLETSAPGIFAAGDIARWPDAHTGESLRIEHWVVAERQGQTAARNMLGQRQRFSDMPFFWSQHYDVPIAYSGHAEKWDNVEIDGDIKKRDCLVRYRRNGKVLAVASIFRDLDNLKAEAAMERS